jgi:signal transduction histidine kinase
MVTVMSTKPGRSGILAAAVCGAVAVVPWVWPRGPGPGWLPGWLAWPCCAALMLPLLAWRRAPDLIAYPVSAAAIGLAAAGVPAGRTAPALMAAACAATGYTDRTRRSVTAAAAAVTAAPAALLISRHPPVPTVSLIAMTLAAGIAAVSGYAIRTHRAYIAALKERAARLEREEGERARQAVTEERQRIAHELHDVIGHAISVIAIQSEAAARSLATDPGAASGFLAAITATSRQSLAEMRCLLAVLRPEDDSPQQPTPLPRLASLPQLIAQVTDAGVPVVLRQDGDLDDLPASIELAAYRIIQEALTNVLKHAAPAQAQVSLTRDAQVLRIQVCDNGQRPTRPAVPAGHGLIGMRERAGIHGGSLQHGPQPGGGYLVTALIPTHGSLHP